MTWKCEGLMGRMIEKLEEERKCGDAYLNENDLMDYCRRNLKCQLVDYFESKQKLIEQGRIVDDCACIYLRENWQNEETEAKLLVRYIDELETVPEKIDEYFASMKYRYTEEQRKAIRGAMSNRMFLILGGAGTGKTTTAVGIIDLFRQLFPNSGQIRLCAPTGKACVNLKTKTGYQADTIDSLLRIGSIDPNLKKAFWDSLGLLIIDEGSVLSDRLMAGILDNINPKTKIVIIGDPNQLQPVGPGAVLQNLQKLGIPGVVLQENHRQQKMNNALYNNVKDFAGKKDLQLDESFQLYDTSDEDAQGYIVRKAVFEYRNRNSFQVIAPTKEKGKLSVDSLNRRIQEKMHAGADNSRLLNRKTDVFYEGDRVIITKNDKKQGCCNGDIGYLHTRKNEKNVSANNRMMERRKGRAFPRRKRGNSAA